MKRTLFALFAVFYATACYSSQIHAPGITAKGLAPKPPSPAYGQLENDSKSLDYDYLLASKSMDYEMARYQMLMDYELKMKLAWQACLKEASEETCMMIHGGWPYYMSYMGMGGYGYMSVMGFYPGCPYQDASYCQTWYETQAYMQQQQAQLGQSSYPMTSSSQLGPEYAITAAEVWSSEGTEDYDKKKAELEKIRDDVAGMLDEMDKRDEELKPLLEAIVSPE